jgi:hypothetical protein
MLAVSLLDPPETGCEGPRGDVSLDTITAFFLGEVAVDEEALDGVLEGETTVSAAALSLG